MVATIPTKGAAGSAPEHLPATATSNEIEAALERDGVVVLLDAIDKDTLARINDEVDPCLEATPFGCESGDEAAESFLGDRTKRLNDCLSLAPSLVPLVAHTKAVDVVRSQLTKHCTSVLVHQTQVVETHPGQKPQPFHRDDVMWPIEGKRFPLSINTGFALSDFTAEMGATQAILGSHRWPEALHYEPAEQGGWGRYYGIRREKVKDDFATVEMPAGSASLWYGCTLHAAGPNTTTDRVRRAFLSAYCLGWLRGELNQQLMWPPEVARKFPREVQRLIGYQLEGDIIGGLEMTQDPIVLLEDE
jgi:ectoine hydroxylase-related dioxygenase (phytanoyl-CoA dioxygenase family)